MKPFLITAGNRNYKLLQSGMVLTEECHEEADTRLIYLALKECNDVIVVSKHTDILILMVWAYAKYNININIRRKWYLNYEAGKFADIGEIVEYFGEDASLALPAFHSLTGCDTTSYFFRIGKCCVFQKLYC